MKTKRLFIAVLLNEEVKNSLHDYAERRINSLKNPSLLKITAKNNLHLTLLFLGDKTEEEESYIIEKLNEITKSYKPFMLTATKTDFFPRIFRVDCDGGDSLLKMQKDISILLNSEEDREFVGHITLGRSKFSIPQKVREIISEEQISFEMRVSEIHLMRSFLGQEGVRYNSVASFPQGE